MYESYRHAPRVIFGENPDVISTYLAKPTLLYGNIAIYDPESTGISTEQSKEPV